MKAKIDKFIGYFISKKLTVFLIATGFVAFAKIDADSWVTIATVYIGTQGVIDAVSKLRKS